MQHCVARPHPNSLVPILYTHTPHTPHSGSHDFPRSWMLPAMIGHIHHTELGYFTEALLPLAGRLRTKGVYRCLLHRVTLCITMRYSVLHYVLQCVTVCYTMYYNALQCVTLCITCTMCYNMLVCAQFVTECVHSVCYMM